MKNLVHYICFVAMIAALQPLAGVAQTPPILNQAPVGAVVNLGSAVTLSANISGSGIGYQWFKDGVRLVNQTNNSLSIASFRFVDGGGYRIMATNAFGTLLTVPVFLNVPGAPLRAWGRDDKGQLGYWQYEYARNPLLPMAVASDVVAVAAGYLHSMCVTSDGKLLCTGYNYDGELGNGSRTDTTYFGNVVPYASFAGVAAGYWHSLAMTSDGNLMTMGWNYSGQLGFNHDYYNANTTPQNVAGGLVASAGGHAHTLFVTSDGILWGMGSDSYGQLGNGTNNFSANPSPVAVASNVVSVAAGSSHSLFVTTDGTLWSMGLGAYGQLGNGANGDTNRPMSVASNVLAVAAGSSHSLFIKADGTLWGMGLNFNGQLGNGTTANTNRPVFVASNVVEVAAAYAHSLFVKSDGTLWAMGGNGNGQLGNGTTVNSSVPVQVTNLICASLGPSTEAYHSLAVAALLPQLTGPTNQNVAVSNAVTFTATIADGDGPFAYQWQFNGTNIANATNNSCAIAAAALSNAGSYKSIVTGMGGATSKSATLTVFLPPQNFQVQRSTNYSLKLIFVGTPNYPYILQTTTNLAPPINWQPVVTNPADINGSWQFMVTNFNKARQFYRALAK